MSSHAHRKLGKSEGLNTKGGIAHNACKSGQRGLPSSVSKVAVRTGSEDRRKAFMATGHRRSDPRYTAGRSEGIYAAIFVLAAIACTVALVIPIRAATWIVGASLDATGAVMLIMGIKRFKQICRASGTPSKGMRAIRLSESCKALPSMSSRAEAAPHTSRAAPRAIDTFFAGCDYTMVQNLSTLGRVASTAPGASLR
jgi:hypothetical protein